MFLQGPFRAHSLPQRPRYKRVGAGEDEQGQYEEEEIQQHGVSFLVVSEERWPQFAALVVSWEYNDVLMVV